MEITDLRSLYVAELQEARSVEAQIADAFDALGARASEPRLKELLHGEVQEAAQHRDRIGELIAGHGEEPRAHDDQAMRAILAEADKWARSIEDAGARDAALVASAQRVQHYEIALYGSLAAWAKELGMSDLERLLAILDEERAADERLSEIAKSGVNKEAVA
ncbi:MAG: Ferritin-like metal-binding protein YciE [Rhodobacteraceae bacterium HLUCCA24]|nr:MAG: Ferritin-like metal-binding protein YciE [Rhodobacteraceae bacterium HLUCCA24]